MEESSDSPVAAPAQPVPPTMMQRIREARGPPATRKTGIILALAIIAVAVIVVTAVMLSVGRDSDSAGGRGLEGEGLLDNKPIAAPITAQEMARILEGIDESLKQSKELVDKYQGMSRHEILKEVISRNVRAVALVDDLNSLAAEASKEARVRAVRDILSAVVDGWDYDNPVFGAVTSEGVVFETPLEVGGFATWNRSETVQEIVSSPEFHERIRTFLELTDGMDDIHAESTGKAIGDDLVEPVDEEKLEEDIVRLQELQDTLVNLTKEESFENSIYNKITPLDLEMLDRMWNIEIKGRQEFGYPQVQTELKDINKVDLTFDDVPTLTEEQLRDLKLKLISQTLAQKIKDKLDLLPRMSDGSINTNATVPAADCNQETELRCDNRQACYFRTERCDRNINCPDNSDEKDCTCKEYLDITKICDGFNDCPDGEDEAQCDCPGKFYCGSWNQKLQVPNCIDMELRCDNIRDCPSGADERYCFELSPDVMRSDIASEPKDKGIVHVRTTAGWKVLSLEVVPDENAEETEAKTRAYAELIGEIVCAETLTFPFQTSVIKMQNTSMTIGDVAHLHLDFSIENSAQLKPGGRYSYDVLEPHPNSVVLDVDCGQPMCGFKADRTLDDISPRGGQSPAQEEVTSDEDKPFGEELDQRIVGGVTVPLGKWPFIVGLTRDGKFVCGATIVDKNWILTAAHCVQGFQTKKYHFQVIAGLQRRFSRSSLEQVRIIEQIVIHKGYNETWLNDDIAMAKVDKSFDYNYMVSNICLPDDNYCAADGPATSPRPGDKCVSAGWGKTRESGNQSDEMREVQIPVLESCKKSYNNIEYQVCGGYAAGGKDTCQGDSGGPLFCEHPDGPGQWFLGGIISHGIGCARPDSPGVYTRVCKYKGWVQAVLANDTEIAKADEFSLERTFFSHSPTIANSKCPTFTCDNGKCIHADEICNIWVSCFDGRDEKFCITTPDGRRVLDTSRYPYKDDEVTTTEVPTTTYISTTAGSIHLIPHNEQVCKPGHFQCKKIFQCVSESARCNMVQDCLDMTDELQCTCRDYIQALSPWRICDGTPDCPQWTDEIGCNYCADEVKKSGGARHYYCNLSKKCIPVSSVCDTKNDCDMREDERYCINIANGERIQYGIDGRPVQHTSGLVAINSKGSWRAVCAQTWTEHINNRVCRYVGRRRSERFRLISPLSRPHLAHSELEVSYSTIHKPVFPRSAPNNILPDFEEAFLDFEEIERPLVPQNFIQSNRTKRQASRRRSCNYIHTECDHYPTCGVFPLYNFLGQDTPEFGPGVYPWHVNLYHEGEYLCGATLVHSEWILTGEGCAKKVNPPIDWVVARMGGFRDTSLSSGTEEMRRVVQITQLPGTKIFLGRFERAVKLSEYINIICIPKIRWIPENEACVITGLHDGALNHAFEIQVDGRCRTETGLFSSSHFDLCAKERAHTGECLNGWSGALACPDTAGRYHAIGVYHSEIGGCNGTAPPQRFTPLVTSNARAGINKIIQTADSGPGPYSDLTDSDCHPGDGKHRCPLGNCIDQSKMCNGLPDCLDASDETLELCQSRGPVKCTHMNATHCQCPSAGDMLCQNQVCVSKLLFCDGNDDCGDGSDEPEDCNDDCAVGLETLGDGDKICDNVIDCRSKTDLASDESAERCCSEPDTDFRCVVGEPTLSYDGKPDNTSVQFTDQCIDSRGVCDGDEMGRAACANGVDESNCVAIWGLDGQAKDNFGRIRSSASGYLQVIINGRAFAYCVNPTFFTEDNKQEVARELCETEGYAGVTTASLVPTDQKQTLKGVTFSPAEQQEFENCMLLFIVCQKTPYKL